MGQSHRKPHNPHARSVDRPSVGPQRRIRTHVVRGVVVLEIAGHLHHVQDLDRAIQMGLADGPRGVVCDLAAVLEHPQSHAVELLATAGRHVRDWPAIPVAVACRDLHLGQALRAHPLGGRLIVTTAMLSAVSEVLATETPAVEWLRLAPHPTAPRAARDFVTRILLDWGLGRIVPSASLVISELVTNSTMHAGTDINLSVVWHRGALRLTVRDNSPHLPHLRASALDQHGRGLTIVSGLSRTFGVLPTSDGGKVVWAVLDAPRPSPSAIPRRSALAAVESHVSTTAAVPRPIRPAGVHLPLEGPHAFTRLGAVSRSTLASTPRRALTLAVARAGKGRQPYPDPYTHPTNHLG